MYTKKGIVAVAIVAAMMATAVQTVPANSSTASLEQELGPAIARNSQTLSLQPGQSVPVLSVLDTWATKNKYTWSSANERVATISPDGMVYAVSEGEIDLLGHTEYADILVTCIVKADTNTPEQEIGPAIALNSQTLFLEPNQSVSVLSVLDAWALKDQYTWSSQNEKVATISSDGMVYAVAEGNVELFGHTQYADIVVKCVVKGKEIAYSTKSLSIGVGQTASVFDVIKPDFPKGGTWTHWYSTNPSVAEIDDNGTVYGVFNGSAILNGFYSTADKNYKLSVLCQVEGQIMASLFSTKNVTLDIGEMYDIRATYPNLGQGIYWTSDNPKVAKVDADGVITAVSSGSCTITATTGFGSTLPSGTKGLVQVTVSKGQIMAPLFSTQNATLAVGEVYDIRTTYPKLGQGISWTSDNPKIAKVDANGVITAVSSGSCIITATTGVGSTLPSGTKGLVQVTVWQPVTSITIKAPTTYLNVGKSITMTASITPKNATNTQYTWKSSNKKVATVTQSGKVTAVGKGTCTITATAKDSNHVQTSVKIQVGIPVNKITLEKSSVSLLKGKTTTINVKSITPSNANKKTLKWTTSNASVAKVSNTGMIKGIGKGTCTITATATDGSGVKATCKVTVQQPVTKIKLSSGTNITLKKGKTKKVTATVSPTTANNKTVKWKSNNTKVATVSQNGTIKAVGKGTCTIGAIATDGSGVKATCKVKVN